jgi:hypothetical protein
MDRIAPWLSWICIAAVVVFGDLTVRIALVIFLTACVLPLWQLLRHNIHSKAVAEGVERAAAAIRGRRESS